MNISSGLLSIAKALSIEDEFPVAILYHGTFFINLKPILSQGLSPRVVDARNVVNRAVEEIASAMGMNKEQSNQLKSSPFIGSAIERVSEGRVKAISVSGQQDYAEGHTGASSEWYHEIINAAQRILYEDYHEQDYAYTRRIHDAWNEMKNLDKELRGLPMTDEGHVRRNEIYTRQRELNSEVKLVEDERDTVLSGARNRMKQQEAEVLRGRFGDEGVLLTLNIPWADLRSLAADSYTKKRFDEFEEQYVDWKNDEGRTWFAYVHGDKRKVWEFFREIHLKSVPARYIAKWQKAV